jgi:hypothetical protein
VVKVDEAGSEPTPKVEMPKWLQLHRGGVLGAGRLRDGPARGRLCLPDIALGPRAPSHGGKQCRFFRPLQASTLGLRRAQTSAAAQIGDSVSAFFIGLLAAETPQGAGAGLRCRYLTQG